MALIQTATPYRQLWLASTNVSEEKRYLGSFGVSVTDGALTTYTRPSAGISASAGIGELFSVAQVGTQYSYTVQILETMLQPIWVNCGYNPLPTTAGTGGSAPVAPTAPVTTGNAGGLTVSSELLSAWASFPDVPATGSTGASPKSNTFYISLCNSQGTIPTGAITAPTNFAGGLNIWFEVIVKPTMVPASR